MQEVGKGGVIKLTRGDTGYFHFPVRVDGEIAELGDEDTIRFTVKRSTYHQEFLVQKTVVGSVDVTIEPVDTEWIPYGDYVYDVELTTEKGEKFTYVGPAPFKLLGEVTF